MARHTNVMARHTHVHMARHTNLMARHTDVHMARHTHVHIRRRAYTKTDTHTRCPCAQEDRV